MKHLFTAATVLAGLLATTSAAVAAPVPTWLKLSAHSGQPGAKVSVAAACDGDAGTITSRAIKVNEPLAHNAEGHQPWALFGETVVADVKPGIYTVSISCAGASVTAQFTVLAAKHQVVKPKGAPRTGDGSF